MDVSFGIGGFVRRMRNAACESLAKGHCEREENGVCNEYG
jgi:hypothetical protein